ncbi:MAG: hypothetical protein AB8G22_07370 [Saprospiraceae bacterium]
MNKPTSPQASGQASNLLGLKRRLAQRQAFRQQIYQSHPQDVSYRYLTDFFHAQRSPLQTFTIHNQQNNIVNGEESTSIFFPKNCCVHLDNQEVKGEVCVELREVRTKADMIFSNLPTTAEGRLLETGGMFYLNIHQSYLPLRLQTSLSVALPLSNDLVNPLALRIYRGYSSFANGQSNACIDWQEAENASTRLERTLPHNSVSTSLRELQWSNIAYPYRTYQRHQRKLWSIRPQADGKMDEVVAFMVFKNINSVARMYWQRGRFIFYNVPTEQPFTVIAIGKTAKQFYYGTLEVENMQDVNAALNLQPITEEELIMQIHYLG